MKKNYKIIRLIKANKIKRIEALKKNNELKKENNLEKNNELKKENNLEKNNELKEENNLEKNNELKKENNLEKNNELKKENNLEKNNELKEENNLEKGIELKEENNLEKGIELKEENNLEKNNELKKENNLEKVIELKEENNLEKGIELKEENNLEKNNELKKENNLEKGIELKEENNLEKGIELKEENNLEKNNELKKENNLEKGIELKEENNLEKNNELKKENNLEKGIELKEENNLEKGIKLKKSAVFLFFSIIDYANVLTEWANCIQKYTNIEAKSLFIKNHPFNYDLKGNYYWNNCNKNDVIKYILKCTHIVIGIPNIGNTRVINFINKVVPKKYKKYMLRKKYISFHYGSLYRDNYKKINKQKDFLKRIYAPDLFRLSPKIKNIDYSFYPIIEKLYKKYKNKLAHLIKAKFNRKKLIIFHCPSNDIKKGSNNIINTVNKIFKKNPSLRERYHFFKPKNKIPNHSVIRYNEKSIIYIDQIETRIKAYGVSSIEAMLTGCITLSHMDYMLGTMAGNAPVININYNNFEKILTNLLKKSNDELKKMIIESFNKYYKLFSPEKFAENFCKNII
jgi:hypothetical protein